MARPSRYSPEFGERAVRRLSDHAPSKLSAVLAAPRDASFHLHLEGHTQERSHEDDESEDTDAAEGRLHRDRG